MNIFAHENIGRNIPCILEKDGEKVTDEVKWTHAFVGEIVTRRAKVMKDTGGSTSNNYVVENSPGWEIVEVGV